MTLRDFQLRRSADKHRAVLDAARHAFAERGYEAVSTAEIAQAAGVSTATLYRRFATKAELFGAALEASMREFGETLERQTGDAPLAALAEAYAEALSEPGVRGLVRAVVAEGARQPEMAERFYQAGKAVAADLFARAAAAEGLPDADVGQLQGMIEHSTLMRGLLLGDAAPPARPPKVTAAEAMKTWSARWRPHD